MKKAIFLSLFFLSYVSKSETFTWPKAVNEASKNNASILKSKLELMSSKSLAKASKSGYYPKISAQIGHTQRNSDSLSAKAETYNATLELKQNLFSGFNDSAKVGEAKAKEKVSQADLKLVYAQVSYDLKKAFTELSFAQESLKLARDIVERRGENLNLVNLRYEGGKENRGSVLLAKATLEQAKYELLQMQQSIGVSKKEFSKVLGRDKFEDLKVEGYVPETSFEEQLNLNKIVVKLPSYLKSTSEVDLSNSLLEQAKSPFYPSLDLVTSISKTDTTFFPKEDGWSVGINLNIPLFDGGRDYYSKQANIHRLYAAKSQLNTVKREAHVVLQKEFFAYKLAKQKLEVDNTFMQAALVRSKIAQEKYNNGLMSFEDWEIIENDITVRKKNYLLAKKNKVFAEASLELARGEGVLHQ